MSLLSETYFIQCCEFVTASLPMLPPTASNAILLYAQYTRRGHYHVVVLLIVGSCSFTNNLLFGIFLVAPSRPSGTSVFSRA